MSRVLGASSLTVYLECFPNTELKCKNKIRNLTTQTSLCSKVMQKQGKQDCGDDFTGVCISPNSSNCVHKMFIFLCINDTSKNLFRKKETLKDGFTLWYSFWKSLEIIGIDKKILFLPVQDPSSWFPLLVLQEDQRIARSKRRRHVSFMVQ